MAKNQTVEERERQVCLKEREEVASGQAPLSFTTMTTESGVTLRRQVAKNLEEKGLEKPGVARASVAASVEHPQGLTEGPHLKISKHRTVLQQHCDFFDRNNDGVITMLDTYLGFRRIGFNIPFSLWAVFVINPAFSLVTSPHWYPDPFFRVFTGNIHRGKHGSDQEVYDTEGRFIPQKYEDIFVKWDREGKGGLNLRDIMEMTQKTRLVFDLFGWFAGKFEWFTGWLLAADDRGLLTKEAVRAIYDGSIFYELEAKYSGRGQQRGSKGGEGHTRFGDWNKGRWSLGAVWSLWSSKGEEHGSGMMGTEEKQRVKQQ